MNITTTDDTNLTLSTTEETTETTTTEVVLNTTTPIIRTSSTDATGDSGMSGGMVAVITVVCILVGVIVLGVALFLWRRKRKEDKRKRHIMEHPLPGKIELDQMAMNQIHENKKQKKSKHKKSKKEIIEKEPPSNVSATSYENVPKEKKEPKYMNTRADGAPAVPIFEEPSSDYIEPEDFKLQYSAAGGIDYYTTKNNNKRDDNYDVPAQKDQENINDSENVVSQHTKDYENVPKKLAPGQAPTPGKSIRREESTDSQQQVYENIENETEGTTETRNHNVT